MGKVGEMINIDFVISTRGNFYTMDLRMNITLNLRSFSLTFTHKKAFRYNDTMVSIKASNI